MPHRQHYILLFVVSVFFLNKSNYILYFLLTIATKLWTNFHTQNTPSLFCINYHLLFSNLVAYITNLYCNCPIIYFLKSPALLRYNWHITCITFRCITCCFDTFIHGKMIAAMVLTNTSTLSYNYFIFLARIVMTYYVNNFHIYNGIISYNH